MHSQAVDGPDSGHTGRAAELRSAFDRAFAEAPRVELVRPLDFLALRLGGDPFAVRVSETAGLFSDRKITRVPTPVAELRGVAGVRGVLVPVYDLAALLGYAAATAPRWLMIAREASVAFAFDLFEGQLRVDQASIIVHDASAREHVREVARVADVSRPIVHLPSVIAALAKRKSESVSRREA